MHDLKTGAIRPVANHDYLTPLQEKMVATQPDLIRAFARMLRQEAQREGRNVAVLAEVLVSLNGRTPMRLIDPAIDIAADRVPPGWILARSRAPCSPAVSCR